jgi:nicotinate-nucleotide pyrophosphorylase (carboxylating)
LEELEEALNQRVDAVLLDNMTVDVLAQGVRLAKGKALTEASGGITPANAAAVAATGVDLLSLGWLTHSSPALDVSLDVTVRV